jgi:hypothetical protein
MKTFTVTVKFEGVVAETPLNASQIVEKWLCDGSKHLAYDVKDEMTNQKTFVDLLFGKVSENLEEED